MFDGAYTRRTLVRRGATAVGLGAIATVAGCSGLDPFGADRAYTDWLPAPGEFVDGGHYAVSATDVGSLSTHEDSLDDEPASLERRWDPLGFDWADASMVISVGSLSDVVVAEFSRADAASTLEDELFEPETDHRGYTIYVRPNGSRAIGVSDGTLVVSERSSGDNYSNGPVDRVQTVIDASEGEVQRYTEANDDMQTLVEELGSGTYYSGRTYATPDEPVVEYGYFENSVARGTAISIDGETSAVRTVVVYESAADADTDDLGDWVDASDGSSADEGTRFADVEDISYEGNGRVGVITGTIDTDAL